VWAAEGEQAIITAFDILTANRNGTNEDDEPQMSG
jgi:hypothetical protein